MFYVKEIPINSVIIVDGTSPRAKIDCSRIAFFKEIYTNNEDPASEIPPVEVSLVQAGEPGKELFALEDGMHRLMAQREIKLRRIKARIRTHISISEAELSSYEVKKHLLMKASESNARHGMPLSDDERKDAVKKMSIYGCTNAEIIGTGIAGKATIYRWLQKDIQERKQKTMDERSNKKEQIRTLLMQGATVKKIVRETGMARTTVRRIMSEASKQSIISGKASGGKGLEEMANGITENDGRPFRWMVIDENQDKLDSMALNEEGKKESSDNRQTDKPTLISESAKEKINKIYEAIRLLEINDATDHEIKIIILPLLQQKFPGVAKIINDGGYAIEVEALQYELKAAKEELQLLRKELLRRNDLLHQKAEQLKRRTEICSYQCEFTTERLRLEFEKYISFMVSHINEHIREIPNVLQHDRDVLKQLTANSIFALLSVLEWGDDNGLTSPKIKEQFEDFKDSVTRLDINHNGITARILMLEKNYHKIPSVPQLAN